MHENFQRCKTILISNGFPANFQEDCVRDFLHRPHTLIGLTLFHKGYSPLPGPALSRCSCIGPRVYGVPTPWRLGRLFLPDTLCVREFNRNSSWISLSANSALVRTNTDTDDSRWKLNSQTYTCSSPKTPAVVHWTTSNKFLFSTFSAWSILDIEPFQSIWEVGQ